MRKQWRTINNFSKYKVSNFGEVKSFRRDKMNGILMKPGNDKNGYKYVGFCINQKTTWFKVHRLVAEHFLDDWNPDLEVDHIDEDKSNNRLNNLRMCTHEKNTHFYHNKRCKNKYRGISYNKNKKQWKLQFWENNKRLDVGLFNTEEEARSYQIYCKYYGIRLTRLKAREIRYGSIRHKTTL